MRFVKSTSLTLLAVLMAGFFDPAGAQVVPSLTSPAATPGPLPLTATPGAQSAGTVAGPPLPLSLADAIHRGLEKNLGVVLLAQEARLHDGKRWEALSSVLHQVYFGLDQRRMMLNPAAFGFDQDVLGPFNVFDARIVVAASILNMAKTYEAKMEGARTDAEELSAKNARDLIVMTVANLYLQVSATSARLAATQAGAQSADAMRASARSAGADSLPGRAQVQGERQRISALENALAKQKLALAQAIGLPHGQPCTLTDPMPNAPMRPINIDAAIERAYQDRADFQAQLARVRAAEAKTRSASSERLPLVRFEADYGKIGPDVERSKMTFGVAATVRVPIARGGLIRGKVLQADAELGQERARLENLRDAIYYEIQNALLDLQAAEQQTQIAQGALDLAQEQLARHHAASPTQSSEFRLIAAGVTAAPADSADLLRAQESATAATEDYVMSLYGYNVAKLALARALGVAEESYMEFLGKPSP